MAKTFLWIEDRKGKASYTFWENLITELIEWIYAGSSLKLQFSEVGLEVVA